MKLIAVIVKTVILIFFLTAALINTDRVPFAYAPGHQIEQPLILILFCTFLIGTVFGIFAMLGRLLRLRAENSRLRKALDKAQTAHKAGPAPALPAAAQVPPAAENAAQAADGKA